MSKDRIRYDLLAQDALRGVVRKVLVDVAKVGQLPGEHHFYIAFATRYPGVRLSQRLREQYPEEMTVVLQHQFWDLGVTDHAFEVGLSFGGIPERLLVPFDSITQFFDPSANFGLKFELAEDKLVAPAPPVPLPAPRPKEMAPVADFGEASARRQPPKGAGTEPQVVAPRTVPKVKSAPKSEPPAATVPEAAPAEGEKTGAEVVSLDKFRKK
jgi:uncharacterized protein